MYILGKLKQEPTDEKTIILVGEIGSGKSTLVDGIVNYVMGVRFDDPFRFTLMQLEEEERMFDYRVFSGIVICKILVFQDIVDILYLIGFLTNRLKGVLYIMP